MLQDACTVELDFLMKNSAVHYWLAYCLSVLVLGCKIEIPAILGPVSRYSILYEGHVNIALERVKIEDWNSCDQICP